MVMLLMSCRIFFSSEEMSAMLSDPGAFFPIKTTIAFNTKVWSSPRERQVLYERFLKLRL